MVGQIGISIVTPIAPVFGTTVPATSFVPATPLGGYGKLRPFREIASEQQWGYVSTATCTTSIRTWWPYSPMGKSSSIFP